MLPTHIVCPGSLVFGSGIKIEAIQSHSMAEKILIGKTIVYNGFRLEVLEDHSTKERRLLTCRFLGDDYSHGTGEVLFIIS